jgi:hypothetical protein
MPDIHFPVLSRFMKLLKTMARIQVALFLIIFLSSTESRGQNKHNTLYKLGGFFHFYQGEYRGYSFNMEVENSFKNGSFTHGPRIDYTRYKTMSWPVSRAAFEALTFGYQFKFYPLHTKDQQPYNGLFLGAYPFFRIPVEQHQRNGPGLGTVLGYQQMIKSKFSLSLEGSMLYLQNINENIPSNNPNDGYFYFNASLKLGITL